MEDVSDIPTPILDAACKRLARSSKFMPTAAEIVAECKAELERRDTRPESERRPVALDLFVVGFPGEYRGKREDGTTIEPYFKQGSGPTDEARGWYVKSEDADALIASYRAVGAQLKVMSSNMIRRTDPCPFPPLTRGHPHYREGMYQAPMPA